MYSSGQDTPKNSRTTNSPTTSTPGLSPGGHQSSPTSNGLRSSELLHSDESLVDTSIDKPTVIEMESTMDTIKEVTLYEKSEEDTTTQDISDVSCVALRTRSRLENRDQEGQSFKYLLTSLWRTQKTLK